MSFLDILLGRRLSSAEEGEQRIGPAAGIPMLGLDALSSSAYGPEAALTIMIPAGAVGITYGCRSASPLSPSSALFTYLTARRFRHTRRWRFLHRRQRKPGNIAGATGRGGANA